MSVVEADSGVVVKKQSLLDAASLIIVVDVGRAAWRENFRDALPQSGRVYAWVRGDESTRKITEATLETLRQLYDVVATRRPRLDLVPLLEALWSREDLGLPQKRPSSLDDRDVEERQPAPLQRHRAVAVGGTFDRLHAGHRLLLTTAALVATDVVYVGIASDVYLAKKKNAGIIEDYATRAAAAASFVGAVGEGLRVEVGPLPGPETAPLAATMEEITGLVISIETVEGARALAKMRRDRGVQADLNIIAVGLVGAVEQKADAKKLSSSEIRDHDAETTCAKKS